MTTQGMFPKHWWHLKIKSFRLKYFTPLFFKSLDLQQRDSRWSSCQTWLVFIDGLLFWVIIAHMCTGSSIKIWKKSTSYSSSMLLNIELDLQNWNLYFLPYVWRMRFFKKRTGNCFKFLTSQKDHIDLIQNTKTAGGH